MYLSFLFRFSIMYLPFIFHLSIISLSFLQGILTLRVLRFLMHFFSFCMILHSLKLCIKIFPQPFVHFVWAQQQHHYSRVLPLGGITHRRFVRSVLYAITAAPASRVRILLPHIFLVVLADLVVLPLGGSIQPHLTMLTIDSAILIYSNIH